MTEDDARKKWCAMINYQIGPVNSSVWQGIAYTNRGQEYNPQACLCIASDCMMWIPTDNETRPSYPGEETISESAGYCGLAGKP